MAFGKKPPKVVDLLEISNFLCKVPCTRVLTQFLAKCCKKWFFTKCHTFCNILPKIGSKPLSTVLCTKSCLFRGDRQVLVVFHQMPYFLQHFAKNWVKTLVHGTLHKKLLISRRSTTFGGFLPNAILFATFC